MIDLHLHTTASDGLCDPASLVDLAFRAGIRTMSVTDHDTVAALTEVRGGAKASGIAFVPGIEITAVHDGRDVHVLGYFIDPEDAPLDEFLEQQRADRVRRVAAIVDRLAEHWESRESRQAARPAAAGEIHRPARHREGTCQGGIRGGHTPGIRNPHRRRQARVHFTSWSSVPPMSSASSAVQAASHRSRIPAC